MYFYKGYFIVRDICGDGWNIMKGKSLIDEGYASIKSAMEAIDEGYADA